MQLSHNSLTIFSSTWHEGIRQHEVVPYNFLLRTTLSQFGIIISDYIAISICYHDIFVPSEHASNPKVSNFLCLHVNSSPPLVPHICISESGQHWFRWWLVAYWAPNHYLNQWWVIVNWTLRNKLQWNFNQNTKFSFLKMHLKISSAISSRGRWVSSHNTIAPIFQLIEA